MTVTTDLAGRILSAVEKRREREGVTSMHFHSDCDLAEKILARHDVTELNEYYCQHDGKDWPCPDVRDLAERYDVTP